MSRVTSEARFDLPDAEKHILALSEIVKFHDAEVTLVDGRYHAKMSFGEARWWAQNDVVTLHAEAPDLASLNGIKMELTSNLSVLSKRELGAKWSGEVREPTLIPTFRLLTVLSKSALTPHMTRIVFSGENLLRFAKNSNLHMRLAFPRSREIAPHWPMVDADGRLVWPEGAQRPILRKYTIRHIDAVAGTVAVDFVLHDDAGPGARFAADARAGDIVGMIGPGGLTAGSADWYLLAGDETALPAIARILETRSDTARGVAVIEVADASEEQTIDNKSGIELRWLHRNGAAPGTTTLLTDAVRAVPFPTGDASVFAWAGCEFESFKSIRSYLRTARGLKKDEYLVVSYWRRGTTIDEMEQALREE